MRFIILPFLLLSLSGCFGNLEQLKLLDPQANDFNSALAAEYLAFADSESEQGRALSAEYFAAKGMRAWHGENVPPESVDAATAKPQKANLLATRELLTDLLVKDVKAVVPQPAARAQLLFDCWVREAGSRKKDTALCVDELQDVLATLEEVAVSVGLLKENTYAVPFLPTHTKPGQMALHRLAKIAAAVRGDRPYVIEISGAAGSPHAAKLLKLRVAEIRKVLAQHGINESHIYRKTYDGEKTVYLSNDSTMKDKNTITVVTRVFNRPPQEKL